VEGPGDAVDAVSDDSPVDDLVPGGDETFGEGGPGTVLTGPGDDAVGDGEDLGLQPRRLSIS
jgi:hypothetical protein